MKDRTKAHLALALVDFIKDPLVAHIVYVDVGAQALPHGALRLLPLPHRQTPVSPLLNRMQHLQLPVRSLASPPPGTPNKILQL
jgi:hypothetical protein